MADILDSFYIEEFREDNLKEVHEFFESQAGSLYSFPLKTFRNATLDDTDFIPDLSIVIKSGKKEIISAMMAIIRKTTVAVHGRLVPYTSTILSMFAVHERYRRRGIGSAMLSLLFTRLKRYKRRKISLMVSVPRYFWPGLDPRYTAAYFFLKKNGFKRRRKERINLSYQIPDEMEMPASETNGFLIQRARHEDKEATFNYVKRNFIGFWHEEVKLSFLNEPCTTFLLKDGDGAIVGFASHSIHFPGSFGPTGVNKNLRGQGLGSLLLKWCMWDIKQSGMDKAIIMWVEGETIKFYSKAIGARIDHVYWPFSRRI
ncbi:MAG: GNAT family N-acetyltransferase [Promethearchaeota archaeon]